VVDRVLQRLGPGVEAGHRRQDDGAGLGELEQAAEVDLRERRLARHLGEGGGPGGANQLHPELRRHGLRVRLREQLRPGRAGQARLRPGRRPLPHAPEGPRPAVRPQPAGRARPPLGRDRRAVGLRLAPAGALPEDPAVGDAQLEVTARRAQRLDEADGVGRSARAAHTDEHRVWWVRSHGHVPRWGTPTLVDRTGVALAAVAALGSGAHVAVALHAHAAGVVHVVRVVGDERRAVRQRHAVAVDAELAAVASAAERRVAHRDALVLRHPTGRMGHLEAVAVDAGVLAVTLLAELRVLLPDLSRGWNTKLLGCGQLEAVAVDARTSGSPSGDRPTQMTLAAVEDVPGRGDFIPARRMRHLLGR